MTLSPLVSALAIPCYLLATGLIFRSIKQQSDFKKRTLLPKAVWLLALLLHGTALGLVLFTATGLNLSFPNALSLVSWFIALLLFFSIWHHPLDSLALMVLPIVSLAIIAGLMTTTPANLLISGNQGLQWHVLSSLLGFSILALGATQALLLSYQDKKLRSHKFSGWVRHLPPLQYMEDFLFQLLTIGFLLLSISLATGWLFIDDIFAQHLVHKTVLSITAWVVFAVLLLGRFISGWRGQQAIRWTLWGFVFLVLAYFGSKLVLEIILQRT